MKDLFITNFEKDLWLRHVRTTEGPLVEVVEDLFQSDAISTHEDMLDAVSEVFFYLNIKHDDYETQSVNYYYGS